MASNKTPAAPAAEAASDTVWLKCEKLGGIPKPFTPAHAKALLKLQEDRDLTDWQPAEAPAAPVAE